jgi:hypothetical protein
MISEKEQQIKMLEEQLSQSKVYMTKASEAGQQVYLLED